MGTIIDYAIDNFWKNPGHCLHSPDFWVGFVIGGFIVFSVLKSWTLATEYVKRRKSGEPDKPEIDFGLAVDFVVRGLRNLADTNRKLENPNSALGKTPSEAQLNFRKTRSCLTRFLHSFTPSVRRKMSTLFDKIDLAYALPSTWDDADKAMDEIERLVEKM